MAVQFADFASAVQDGRVDRHASDRRGIPRSSVIWAAKVFDARVGEVMSNAGFDMVAFGQNIGASTVSPQEIEHRRRHLIEPEFVDTLESAWVLGGGDWTPVAVAELAYAVLTQASGRVHERLLQAGGDIEAAATHLSTMLAAQHGGGTEPKTAGAGVPPHLPGTVMRVSEVSPERFGIVLTPGTYEMPPYFPREADDEIVDALRAQAPAVVVTAGPKSGAIRTVYEALQRTSSDEMLLLADELAPDGHGVDPEQLLASGASIVWVWDLRRLARAAPDLWGWFSERREEVLATVVAVVGEHDEELVKQAGLAEGAVRVSMTARLTEAEREVAQDEFGRELATIGEVVRASRPHRPEQAAYLADSYDSFGPLTPTNDALDIGPDVRMLASLVASRQVLPPLSIGLFGQWGSGKSFLMNQIKLGAAGLALRSQHLQEGEKSGYCAKVITIDFNAWQYVHGVDLWASLVSRVFEGIREQLAGTGRTRSCGRTSAS